MEPAAAIMAHRLMGGQAALMAARMKISATRRSSGTPMATSTALTRPPTVNTVVAPEPVMAPGTSITAVSRIKQTNRWAWKVFTITRTMYATPPLSL